MIGLDEHRHVSKSRKLWAPTPEQKMVVPLRDPILTAITFLNRAARPTLGLLRQIAAHRYDPRTHFFRVDCPQHERAQRLTALAEFVGAKQRPASDWLPVNPTAEDTTGLRREYTSDRLPAELQVYVDELLSWPDVMALYHLHGYKFFWSNILPDMPPTLGAPLEAMAVT